VVPPSAFHFKKAVKTTGSAGGLDFSDFSALNTPETRLPLDAQPGLSTDWARRAVRLCGL